LFILEYFKICFYFHGHQKGAPQSFFWGKLSQTALPPGSPTAKRFFEFKQLFIPTLQDATGAWAQLRFVVETMQMERTAAMQSTMQGTKLVKDHSNIVAITYRLLLTFVSANVM